MKRRVQCLIAVAGVGFLSSCDPFATGVRFEGITYYDADAFDRETYKLVRDHARKQGATVLRCEVSEFDERGITSSRTVWDARGVRTKTAC